MFYCILYLLFLPSGFLSQAYGKIKAIFWTQRRVLRTALGERWTQQIRRCVKIHLKWWTLRSSDECKLLRSKGYRWGLNHGRGGATLARPATRGEGGAFAIGYGQWLKSCPTGLSVSIVTTFEAHCTIKKTPPRVQSIGWFCDYVSKWSPRPLTVSCDFKRCNHFVSTLKLDCKSTIQPNIYS